MQPHGEQRGLGLDPVCGRYANIKVAVDVVALYGARNSRGEELPPSWNVALTDPVYGVVDARTSDGPGPRAQHPARWSMTRRSCSSGSELDGTQAIDHAARAIGRRLRRCPTHRGEHRHRNKVRRDHDIHPDNQEVPELV
ncbi:MAG: hypothetical protein GEU78_14115 [Actinobacteria bacterium]|nr:hypothetical protein [Actinomycetota bacterium]